MYKRCLILGGKGFIGSHLVKSLLSSGISVRVFDQSSAGNLIDTELVDQVEFVYGDFSDGSLIAKALNGCDVCFHLISTTIPATSNEAPAFDLKTNALNTINFLEYAHLAGLKKIVFLSSGGTVYGIPKYLPIDELHPTEPICSYGISKLTIEKYLSLFNILHGIEYSVLRVSNPYGEGQRTTAAQGAVAVFLGKALKKEQISIWGDGSVARDYIYIGDVIDAMILAMKYTGKERVFNIGSGEARTLAELVSSIEMALGNKLNFEFKPARKLDVPVNVLDITRAKNELNWTPKVSMHDGLIRMKNWIVSQEC